MRDDFVVNRVHQLLHKLNPVFLLLPDQILYLHLRSQLQLLQDNHLISQSFNARFVDLYT